MLHTAGDEPQEALGMFQPGPDWNGPAMAVLLNKADLVSADELTALESWYKQHCRAEQVRNAAQLKCRQPLTVVGCWCGNGICSAE